MTLDPGRANRPDARPSPGLFEGRPLADPDESLFDQGLAFDVETLLDRRRMLRLLGYTGMGAAAVALAACTTSIPSPTARPTLAGSPGEGTPVPGAGGRAAASAAAQDCAVIPEETAGPFPGDGSNGPDVLTETGVVRSDIRSSFANGSALAGGVPLVIRLVLHDAARGCAPLSGAAVYLWHCDREGRYSLYSPGVTGEDYLRGVQVSDASGRVSFQSVFPGCYPGRWPHVHFEVYPSLAKATAPGSLIATSQLALPEDACRLAYATDGYGASVPNLAGVSLRTDNVFADDGGIHQLGTVTGSIDAGMTVELRVPLQTA